MKLGKFSLAILSTVVALNASAQVYNTGYNTSVVAGQLVDNLWKVTALINTPTGSGLPSTFPYQAFVLPAPLAWPWDYSAQPAGAQNSLLTQWDSNQQPAFGGTDTNGMITTYTLNFNAPAAGSSVLYFECDNYLDMYLGAIAPANRFYSEQPAHNGADFAGWQNTTVNFAAGANQLNIMVYNYPQPYGNWTGLRVNFGINVVPEPSSLALAAGGLVALLAAIKRRK